MEGAQSSLGLKLTLPQQWTATEEEDVSNVRMSACWFVLWFTSMEPGEISIHIADQAVVVIIQGEGDTH